MSELATATKGAELSEMINWPFLSVRYTWMCFLIHLESIRTFSEWNLLNPVQYNVFFFIYMKNASKSEPSSLLTCKSHTAYCKSLFCCCVVIFLFSCGTVLRHHLSMNMLFYKIQVSNVYGQESLLALVLLDFFFFFFSNAHLQSHVSRWQVSYGAERTPKCHPPPQKSPGLSGEIMPNSSLCDRDP